MNTNLTHETEQAILHLGHAFDGYTYAQQVWQAGEEHHRQLEVRLNQVQTTGRFFLRAADNFAVNFYLHRLFHHGGDLPSANSPHWYTMVFFYLHLYRVPVPEAHRHLGMYPTWANRPKGSAEAAAAEIRQLLCR
ncbi:MAG TPA: hypothetical protein VF629_10700 [Hymenobacter sp.]|jgi:hypothetical protein|uniref:hypothetical protein n=1 Tax=Hymenobacter sp. TaxID=1898978 RepID=UPI002ED990CA